MNLILSGSSVLFPFITFPLVSRGLGADMYGLCNWSFSVASWFSLFAMLGVNRYGIREIARHRDNEQALVKVSTEILVFTLITTAIVLGLFIASIFAVPNFAEHRELFFINALTVLCNTLGVGWFFQGIEQYRYITIRGVLIKIACFVGVLLLVHVPDDYLAYAALVVLASALANLINFAYMIYLLQKINADMHPAQTVQGLATRFAELLKHAYKRVIKPHFKPMLSFFIITATISIYTMLDTVMLGFLSTTEQTGYYSAAVAVKNALVGVVSALTGVLLPRASNLLANGKRSEFQNLIKKCILIVAAVAIPASIVLSVFATPLITWYAGSGFVGAGQPLSIVALAIAPISLSIIFYDAVLIPNGKERYIIIINTVAAVVDFTANLVLIPMFGATGAAISTLCVELYMVLAGFICSRKFIWGH